MKNGKTRHEYKNADFEAVICDSFEVRFGSCSIVFMNLPPVERGEVVWKGSGDTGDSR